MIDFDGPLADCTRRMVRLLNTPQAIPVLYRATMPEVCYWLLTGLYGGEVVGMTLANSQRQRVIWAIHRLRDELCGSGSDIGAGLDCADESIGISLPVQGDNMHDAAAVPEAAATIGSTRLMVSDAANVENAAFHVGYERPSHVIQVGME